MAASASDYFQKVGRGTATTLSAPGYTTGVSTSINVGSTSSWPTDTGVTFAIDETELSGGEYVRTTGTYNVYRGTVSSATQINNVVWVGGDGDRNYSAGSTTRVYILVTSAQTNRLIDGILAEHNQDGTHGAVTADSLTVDGTLTQTGVASFTTHIDVNDSSTAIRDSSDNELLKFAKTASAVNEITVTNAATGAGATLSATGGDPNIDFNVATKGTGKLKVNGNTISDGNGTSWSPTLTGYSANPTSGLYYYTLLGKWCCITIQEPNNGTSNATTCTYTLPFTALTRTNARWIAPAEAVDNGVVLTSPAMGVITSGGTVVTVAKDFGFNAFTASGGKRIRSLTLWYEIA